MEWANLLTHFSRQKDMWHRGEACTWSLSLVLVLLCSHPSGLLLCPTVRHALYVITLPPPRPSYADEGPRSRSCPPPTSHMPAWDPFTPGWGQRPLGQWLLPCGPVACGLIPGHAKLRKGSRTSSSAGTAMVQSQVRQWVSHLRAQVV